MRRFSWFSSALVVVCVGLCACLGPAGCGSSSSSGAGAVAGAGENPEPKTTTEEERHAEALRRHRARQEAACMGVATTLTDCAIADARATMSAEEFAKLDVDRLAPAHRAEFMDSCTTSDMSVRQLEVFEGCTAEKLECPAFLDCLDQAKPQ